MKIIITGCAGFIGMHVARSLLERGDEVFGIDNLNSYYDVNLKLSRLEILKKFSKFHFTKMDLSDRENVNTYFSKKNVDSVIHLAAQAGVRHSINFPDHYIDNNLLAFGNVLECSRLLKIKHLVFASSSSVYGGSLKIPFKEDECPNTPNSLYAATKKSNELMAYSYSHLHRIPISGLRFFTVYGPWGRPDMVPFLFTNSILERKAIKVFNNGDMSRDFTYIDDVVNSLILVHDKPPSDLSNGTNNNLIFHGEAPYNIFNVGNNSVVSLLKFIKLLEKQWGKESIKEYLPMQPGDIKSTCASIDKINAYTGYTPSVSIEDGIAHFCDWFKSYYKILL
jgi:UDP-glucuronate 4-epimerase